MLAAVRWWWSQAAGHGRQSPLLNIGFDEDESHLAEIDVNSTRAVSPNGREEVLAFQVVRELVQLLAVPGEENGAGARSVPYADDVSLDIRGSIRGGSEGLVPSAMPT